MCTVWRIRTWLVSLKSCLRMPRMSMQNDEVRAVNAPSALGKSADINAMKKIICTQCGKCCMTTVGKIWSPVAVMPLLAANRYSRPPSSRNRKFTPINTTLNRNIFFCASRKFGTLIFFCIIS